MREMCDRAVDNCEHCQRYKNRTHLPYGKMAEVEEPATMGVAYSVDFLTNMPTSTAARYNACMVVCDRWSRRVFAIPCRDTTTAKEAALLFYNEICLHLCRGLPCWLQMDRDPRFRSSWFREFYRLSGVHLHFTTGYKSQSNGLAERCNRKLSQLLRNPSADQANWVELLRHAVMAMNEMKQERLGVTAIEAETGVRPRGILDFDPHLLQNTDGCTVVNPEMTDGQHRDAVAKSLDKLLCLRHLIEEQRGGLQEEMMDRFDRRYKELREMEQGTLVMVEAKHISVPAKKVKGLMEAEKLQPRWFGPYRIVAWHNECDVEIQRGGQYGLHPRSRVHPVFHISKVKQFKGDSTKLAKFAAGSEGDRWEVEAILDHRGDRAIGKKKSTREYFVQWKNYNMEDYTWEKEEDVLGNGDQEGANELVDEYFKRLEYLESRKRVVDEHTAAPLTDEEITSAQNMVVEYELAKAINERERIAAMVTREQDGNEEWKGTKLKCGMWTERGPIINPVRVKIEEWDEDEEE
jgi:hypothetical protein